MLKVSVIIPNFNRAAIVGETIQNMLDQELKPYEIIVVDDGSTDNSIEVIESFGSSVILVKQLNKGPGAARNAGLKIARGEYIQFMDSDDLMSLNKLRVQADTLNESGADMVYGPWVKIWISKQGIRLQDVVLQQKPLPESHTALEWFLAGWSMVFQQCLLRKSILDKVGGYNETMYSLEDGDLFVRLILADAKLMHEDKTLTFYRLDDYGKLTETGQNNERRVKDQLTYYNLLHQYALENRVLRDGMKQMSFKKNLSALLKNRNSEDLKINYSYLADLKLNHVLYGIINSLHQKSAGIQHRLKGHRWPKSYQTSALTEQQHALVKQLNWKVVD